MPKINFREPPKTENKELDQYLWELHNLIVGVGSALGILDSSNVNGELTDTVDHAEFTNVTSYQHHGTGSHSVLDQATDPTNSTLSITTADADATYGTEERDLINELKADFNSHITEFNTLLTNLRSANVIG